MKLSIFKSLSLLAACGGFLPTFVVGHQHDEMAQQHLNAERLRLEKVDGSVSKEEKQELERLWGFEVSHFCCSKVLLEACWCRRET